MLLVTLLIAVSSLKYIYRHSCLTSARELICIYVVFYGHVCCLDIYGNSMVNNVVVVFLITYTVMWSLCVDYSRVAV